MDAIRTKVIEIDGTQAVRLPDGLGLETGDEVEIERIGDTLRVTPARPSMAEMVRRHRELPRPESPWVRFPIEIPDRFAREEC